MSFKTELESLIANANSSLHDLESIAGRARTLPTDGNGSEKTEGDAAELRRQFDTVCRRLSASLLDIQKSYRHDQQRLSDLEGELKLDLENVRQCAIDYFIKGQYRECINLLTFLGKLQPHDEDLERFLELSRRKQFENEAKKQSLNLPSKKEGSANGSSGSKLDPTASSPLPFSAQDSKVIAEDQPITDSVLQSRSQRNGKQSLANLELKSRVVRDNESYWDELQPARRRPFVWVAAAALLVVLALGLYRLWRSSPETPDSESQTTSDSVPQTEPVPATNAVKGAFEEALRLFDAGSLQAAQDVCDGILAGDPQDPLALELKGRILKRLEEGKFDTAASSPETPEKALLNTVVLSQSLGVRAGAGTSQYQPQLSNTGSLQVPSSRSSPMSEARGPVTRSQASPIQNSTRENPLVSNQPTASNIVSAPSQISSEELIEVKARIEAREFDQARALLGRLEGAFPGNPEVRALGDRLRVETGKQQNAVRSWIEKAEQAQIAGRYVTPPDDNVLVYCNQALKVDPGNQRATNLKKEIVGRAVAQAEEWIQRGKFDAARLFYASMEYLALNDNAFPYPKANLKRDLDNLAFTIYPVVHDHKLGSCSGTLKFNAYGVSYAPSGGSDDGFAENLSAIVINAEGDRLRISYRERTFRFRRAAGGDVQAIYEQLMNRMTDEKSRVAGRNKDTRQP